MRQRLDARRILVGVRGVGGSVESVVEDAARYIAQSAQCDAVRVVPECVERRLHRSAGGSGDEHIAIAIIEFIVPVEIAVLVIAAACDADFAVDEQYLVVHALVEFGEATKDTHREFERRRARLVERRVVDAQFEIHMRARELRE